MQPFGLQQQSRYSNSLIRKNKVFPHLHHSLADQWQSYLYVGGGGKCPKHCASEAWDIAKLDDTVSSKQCAAFGLPAPLPVSLQNEAFADAGGMAKVVQGEGRQCQMWQSVDLTLGQRIDLVHSCFRQWYIMGLSSIVLTLGNLPCFNLRILLCRFSFKRDNVICFVREPQYSFLFSHEAQWGSFAPCIMSPSTVQLLS